MRYLLDVNVLVAWGWSDHTEHGRTINWIANAKREDGDGLLVTSPITQLGFVRVSVQRVMGAITVGDASKTLAGMLSGLGSKHHFLADDQAADSFPAWCGSAGRTTDAHLLQLAAKHGVKLATLDGQIPNAFIVPL